MFWYKDVPNISWDKYLMELTYTKNYSLFIWSSNLAVHTTFLFSTSDSPMQTRKFSWKHPAVRIWVNILFHITVSPKRRTYLLDNDIKESDLSLHYSSDITRYKLVALGFLFSWLQDGGANPDKSATSYRGGGTIPFYGSPLGSRKPLPEVFLLVIPCASLARALPHSHVCPIIGKECEPAVTDLKQSERVPCVSGNTSLKYKAKQRRRGG